MANIMNNYFINVTKSLNLKKQLGVELSSVNEFENHISIKMIHGKYPEILPESFKFQFVSNNEVKKEIENLDTKKPSTYGCIPATSIPFHLKTMCKCLSATSHEFYNLFYSTE